MTIKGFLTWFNNTAVSTKYITYNDTKDIETIMSMDKALEWINLNEIYVLGFLTGARNTIIQQYKRALKNNKRHMSVIVVLKHVVLMIIKK